MDMRHEPSSRFYPRVAVTYQPVSSNQFKVAAIDYGHKDEYFKFFIEEVDVDPTKQFIEEYVAHHQRMIRFPRSNYFLFYPALFDISHTIHLPKHHRLIINFNAFNFQEKVRLNYFTHFLVCADYLEMHSVIDNTDQKLLWRKCGTEFIPAAVHNQSVKIIFHSDFKWEHYGFSLTYSILSEVKAPREIKEGVFDCSQHYELFRTHLDCNTVVECEMNEDERKDCDYHSVENHNCPPGSVSAKVF